MTTPRTMPGVLELLPREQIAFQGMLDTIRRVYELHGFVPIETPAIELSEILLTKSGGETERQVYFVQSTGSLEQDGAPELALRFDLTVPLARYVAEHEHELVFPFRRYQIQRSYRGERAQRGRFREFYQCDIDVVDRDELSIRHDAEIPAVVVDVFQRLAIGSFTVRISNRKVLQGFLRQIGIQGADRQAAIVREIDKVDKRGVEAVAATLADMGLDGDSVQSLLDLIGVRSAGGESALAALDELVSVDDEMVAGVEELRQVFSTLAVLGVDDDVLALDLSIARGLDYYTGTIYETTLDDHPELGSICSGGRYDDLASHYTKTRLPGVGISIGLTRLYWQLREIGTVEPAPSTVAVLVTVMDDEGLDHGTALAGRLRAAGIATEVVSGPGKLAKQLRYADRSGIRSAVIAGPDERSAGTVTIKDLATQEQHEVPEEAVVDHFIQRSGDNP